MNSFFLTLHVIISVLLIGGILLQPGAKGGGLGATFGGGGAHSAFGAKGAAPFLAKLTYWLGGIFMATSLLIEVYIVGSNRTVLDKGKPSKPAVTNTTPAQPKLPAPGQTSPTAPAQTNPTEPAQATPAAPAQTNSAAPVPVPAAPKTK